MSAGRREDIAGSALARVLSERLQAPVSAEQGRALLLSLVRLNELGALAPSLSATSPGESIPGSLPTSTPPGVLGSGTRVGRQGDETAPAHNMGQSVYEDGQDQ